MSTQVSFGPVTVNFQTSSRKLAAWISDYYEVSDPARNLQSTATMRFAVELAELNGGDAGDFRVPDDAASGTLAFAGSPCLYSEGRFFSSSGGDLAHRLVVDIHSRRAIAELGGTFLSCKETFVYNFLRDLTRKFIFPLSQIVVLHGAVVTNGSQTIFLSGEKGMGKSTTALMLLERGFRMLSDDSPLCISQDGQAYILSSMDELSVTPETLGICPFLKDWLGERREVSGKYFVSRKLMPPNMFDNGPVPITHFISLRRGAYDAPVLSSGNLAELTFELLKESMLIFRYPSVQGFDCALDTISPFIIDTTASLLKNSKLLNLEFNERHGHRVVDLLSVLD